LSDADGSATPAAARAGRLRVSQWFALAAAVLGAVTLAGIVLGTIAVVRLADERRLMVDNLDPAAVQALRLTNSYVNEETGVRGYVLAGEPGFLEPYRSGRVEEERALSRLRGHVRAAGLTELSDDLMAVERAAEAWRRRYARPTILRVREDGPGAIGTAGVARGQRLFSDLRSALAHQRAGLARARATGRDDLTEAATFLSASFVAIALLVATALLGTLFVLRRTVTLPVGALARRVRRVARGEYDAPVVGDGPRDIAELADDIDSMRRQIVDELSQLRAAHDRLDAQARDLERSNAELEQFAYVASHDLQEPLRKVASFCQLLEQRYRGQLDERGEQYIDFAVDGAKRMQQLINDLLAFSRVGRTSGDFAPVELAAVARRAVANLDAALAEADAQVEIGALPTVLGEASLLTTVFQNLIGNAIKFRSGPAPQIRLTAEPRDGEWLISCSDDGIGIDAEYAERVFVIFQRLHPKDQYAGTGIGLAMCRKIVEHHGGRIWLDADARPGTTFRFTLPALEETR
jgi:signal transduction histidine kinase